MEKIKNQEDLSEVINKPLYIELSPDYKISNFKNWLLGKKYKVYDYSIYKNKEKIFNAKDNGFTWTYWIDYIEHIFINNTIKKGIFIKLENFFLKEQLYLSFKKEVNNFG